MAGEVAQSDSLNGSGRSCLLPGPERREGFSTVEDQGSPVDCLVVYGVMDARGIQCLFRAQRIG